MANIPQPTLIDKLMIIPTIGRVIAAVTLRAITGPVMGGPRAKTYLKDVVYAALRTFLSATSAETEQWINPSTEAGYLQLAKEQKFQPETTVLESGLKLHWIGPKTAKKVFLFFHGGGYVLSCSPGHYNWLFDLQQALAKEASVSVVLVGYTLAPHGQYPKQLQEAVESLQWLLETQKYKPSDIIVGGDSAGGNMATTLLLHLLHPHSDVSSGLKLREPLASAVLISPWWKFKTDDDNSVKRNATSDMVTPVAADRWSSLFLGSAAADSYNQPYLADASWFKGLDKVVKDILVWGGGGEILIDSIESVTKKLKEAFPKTELVVEPGAGHEDFIFDKTLGYKAGKGAEVVESWIAQRLR